MTDAKRKTIGEMSADTRILINYVTKRMVKDGEMFISYAELNAAIGGRNVQAEAHGILATARQNVERDCCIVIETVRTEGITLSTKYTGVLAFAAKQARRLVTKASRRVVNAIDEAELSNEERISIGAYLSGLAAIRLCGATKNIRKLEGRLKETTALELPTAETLRLFEK